MGDENVAGLVEGIIFLGGLEHGLFLPSLSGMFGARFSSGYEFAVGPNLSSWRRWFSYRFWKNNTSWKPKYSN